METKQAELSQMKMMHSRMARAVQQLLQATRAKSEQRAMLHAQQLQFTTSAMPLLTIRWEVVGSVEAEREVAQAA